MVKHIQNPKTGKLAGSIGDGKNNIPQPSQTKPTPSQTAPLIPKTGPRPVYELIELSVNPKFEIHYPIIRKYTFRTRNGTNDLIEILDESGLDYSKYWDPYKGAVEFTIRIHNQKQLIKLAAVDANIDMYQTKLYASIARQQYKDTVKSNNIRKFFHLKQKPVTEIKTDKEIEDTIIGKYRAVEQRTGIKLFSN